VSNRETGDKYAEEVCDLINRVFRRKGLSDYSFKITKNSGATHRDTDMKNHIFAIDCKTGVNKLPSSISAKDAAKTSMQAELSDRVGVTVVNTKEGQFAVCDLGIMISLMATFIESSSIPDTHA